MSKLSGGRVNYYLAEVLHPQREDQAPYQAECEDIADALKLTPNEFCEFKAIWRTAAARLGNGKEGQKALYDAQKRVHYAMRDLRALEREHNAQAASEPAEAEEEEAEEHLTAGTVVDNGWIVHDGDLMPDPLDPDDLVDVRLYDGVEYDANFAKPAKLWVWVDDGTHSRITHYRLAKRVEQPTPPAGEWKTHTTEFMPEGLDPDEMVEVKLNTGHELIMARRADSWDWAIPSIIPDGIAIRPFIAAWRRYRHNAG